MFFSSFRSQENFKPQVAQDAFDAFEITPEDKQHIGSSLFGEFMGRTSKGESWKLVIADLEKKHPEYDVKELIEGVADANLVPWKNVQ